MTATLEGGEGSATRPGRNLPPGKKRYPFYRRLGGLQGRSGRAENLVPTGIRSRTHQPVAQSLYRLSYRAHMCFVRISEFAIISLYRVLQPKRRVYCADLTECVRKFGLIFASEELIISYPALRWDQLSTFVAEHLRTSKWALCDIQTSEHKDFLSRNIVLIDPGSIKKRYKL